MRVVGVERASRVGRVGRVVWGLMYWSPHPRERIRAGRMAMVAAPEAFQRRLGWRIKLVRISLPQIRRVIPTEMAWVKKSTQLRMVSRRAFFQWGLWQSRMVRETQRRQRGMAIRKLRNPQWNGSPKASGNPARHSHLLLRVVFRRWSRLRGMAKIVKDTISLRLVLAVPMILMRLPKRTTRVE
jgi:hypothetical protein